MEFEKQELESNTPENTKNKNSKEILYRTLLAGGLLLNSTGTSNVILENLSQKEKDNDLDPGITEMLGNEERIGMGLDIFNNEQEFCFLDPSIGSGLDSEGLAVERETDLEENINDDITVIQETAGTELDSDREIAESAIRAATEEFAGNPYSWNAENHHCSGYVANYFKHLGFNVAPELTLVSEYSPKLGDTMPNSTTVKQVPYLRMIAQHYGSDLASEMNLETMLSNRNVWSAMPPGTVLYLPERIGHHGYDTFTHTAIFMGLDEDQEPMFSEFSAYMRNGPESGHGFSQFTRMYRGQDIEPYNSNNGPLKVFLFNAVEASRRIRAHNFTNTAEEEGRRLPPRVTSRRVISSRHRHDYLR
jgi:hypothetical protein